MEKQRILGVLGGLGPMATAYFYEMLTFHTPAECDQDHIDMVISSKATTPDRTAYITGKSDISPLPYMLDEAKRIEKYGADLLVIPCNTAHYFYDELKNNIGIEMINIVDETVEHCIKIGAKKIGILATRGTIGTETYQRQCKKRGLNFEVPDNDEQDIIMSVIYDDIKTGKRADMEKFMFVANSLIARGCDKLILGCTELSLIKKAENLSDDTFVDSLEALAYRTIKECGKSPCNFHKSYYENEVKEPLL